MSMIVCPECGHEISDKAKKCTYCGYPIKSKGNKTKLITIIVAVTVCAISVILAVYFKGPSLSEDEQIAYQNAVEMRSLLETPNSFALGDTIVLLKKISDDGSVDYTYTIFDYVGANQYGSLISGEAIFKDHKYIMDYTDTPIKDNEEKMAVQFEIKKYLQGGGGKTLQAVIIDSQKIKDKMGLTN